MQMDYRCYVHFRNTAAFDRALKILTVQTTGGAFFGGGFGGALAQLSEVQNAPPEELLALVQEMGIDLRSFESPE